MSDSDVPADPASAALAAAKAAAMEKVKGAAALRRKQESAGAAGRRGSISRERSSGDRTDWDEPRSFGESVGELLSVRGWEGEVAVARVLAEWHSIVGADLAAKTTPIGLNGGVLSLEAESTAWATQVRLLSSQIIDAVAERFGAGVVTSVTARGPSGLAPQRGAWRSPDSRGPRDTYG